jgi:hypothetical protein
MSPRSTTRWTSSAEDDAQPRYQDATSMARVGAVVRKHGAEDACIVSSLERPWLIALADLEPRLPAFLSYPADKGGASQKAWLKPVVTGVVSLMRLSLPTRLPGMLRGLQGVGSPSTIRW